MEWIFIHNVYVVVDAVNMKKMLSIKFIRVKLDHVAIVIEKTKETRLEFFPYK